MKEQVITEKDVLYEDNHLIAINKLPGILVQGDNTGDKPLVESLKDFLKKKYDKPGNVFAGLIHRLDRPVGGLVLFAKTSKGLTRMNEVFKKREVEKIYWAVTEGKVEPDSALLQNFLWKDHRKNMSFTSKKEKDGYKKAELQYTVLRYMDHYTLLEVKPKTGRHHQIRVQLSHIGHPLKGDLKYGSKRSNQDGSICLLAKSLSFMHPIKKEKVKIETPVPTTDIWKEV